MSKLSIGEKRKLVRKAQLIAALHGMDITEVLDGEHSCEQHCRKNDKGCVRVDDEYYFDLREVDNDLSGDWCFAWLDKKYYKA